MKRTNESGRSMVEMLGVLAIIGVLSVGGIAGYTMAMNRYRANEVIDMANKYAVIAFSARETNRAMHNGVVTSFTAPGFCDTGLVATTTTGAGSTQTTSCKVNGTEITLEGYYDDTVCSAANKLGSDAADNSTTAVGVNLTLAFDDDAVCKAAASTLGSTCSSSRVTFCSRNS